MESLPTVPGPLALARIGGPLVGYPCSRKTKPNLAFLYLAGPNTKEGKGKGRRKKKKNQSSRFVICHANVFQTGMDGPPDRLGQKSKMWGHRQTWAVGKKGRGPQPCAGSASTGYRRAKNEDGL